MSQVTIQLNIAITAVSQLGAVLERLQDAGLLGPGARVQTAWSMGSPEPSATAEEIDGIVVRRDDHGNILTRYLKDDELLRLQAHPSLNRGDRGRLRNVRAVRLRARARRGESKRPPAPRARPPMGSWPDQDGEVEP